MKVPYYFNHYSVEPKSFFQPWFLNQFCSPLVLHLKWISQNEEEYKNSDEYKFISAINKMPELEKKNINKFIRANYIVSNEKYIEKLISIVAYLHFGMNKNTLYDIVKLNNNNNALKIMYHFDTDSIIIQGNDNNLESTSLEEFIKIINFWKAYITSNKNKENIESIDIGIIDNLESYFHQIDL